MRAFVRPIVYGLTWLVGMKSVTNADPSIYSECSRPGHLFHLEKLDIIPDPPVQGANVVFNGTFNLEKPVEEGAIIKMTAKVGSVEVFNLALDICERIKEMCYEENGECVSCPVAKGSHNLKTNLYLPKAIPKLRYGLVTKAYTKDEEELVCLDFTFDFRTQGKSSTPEHEEL